MADDMDLQAPTNSAARQQALAALKDGGLMAVLRTSSPESAVEAARALAAGGVRALEVTFTVPRAAEAIAALAADVGAGRFAEPVLIGAGTVITPDQARTAVEAGARFLVSPHTSQEVLVIARELGTAVLPGAFTPGEIFAAHKMGGDIIKIFPAARMGPTYLRDLRGPYPDIPMMPSGGVTVENVAEWFGVGAVAVSVGGELLPKEAVAAGRWDELTARARRFIEAVRQARQSG